MPNSDALADALADVAEVNDRAGRLYAFQYFGGREPPGLSFGVVNRIVSRSVV